MTGFIKPIRLLSNFTAGAMLLLFQPFKVGDLIEAADIFGTVEQIELFNTIIITPDNRRIMLCNAQIISEKISNYSAKGILRLELRFGLTDDDDLSKVKCLLRELITSHQQVLNKPSPKIAIVETADNRVNLAMRPYVKVEDYWDVHFDLMERIKLLFEQEGISAPYSESEAYLVHTVMA